MNVPEGWFDYSRFGSPIDSTRIVAVKTPLKRQFNTGRPAKQSGNYAKMLKGVPIEEEFTPGQMLEQFRERGWNVGLVIDLTFTNRYYEPQELVVQGVKHMKIKCPGQVIPPDDVYHKLSTALSEFLSDPSNDDALVAVHCTHGLNRTGYLVCRYLIDNCGYDVETAIEAFNKGRGSDIERESYLENLRNGCPRDDTPSKNRNRQPADRDTGHHTAPYDHQHHEGDVRVRRGSVGVGGGVVAKREERDMRQRSYGRYGEVGYGRNDLRAKLNRKKRETAPDTRREEQTNSRKRACYMDGSSYYRASDYHDDTWRPPPDSYHTHYDAHRSAPGYHSQRGVDAWAGQASYDVDFGHREHIHENVHEERRGRKRKRYRDEPVRR